MLMMIFILLPQKQCRSKCKWAVALGGTPFLYWMNISLNWIQEKIQFWIIFLNWISSEIRKLIFLNWIFLINKVLNIFWIEYFWKFKFWIILWIEFLPKNKWMNKSLNQYLSFYIEWIKKIFIVRKLTETKFSSWRAKPLWPKLGTSNLEIGTQQVLGFSWNMDQRETQTRN